jgi:competence protein ComEC
VQSGVPLKADFLLVPHHGSRTSSSPELLEAVAPSLAFVQAGYRNRFGHPAAPVVARYRERAITLLDSPHCGALTWHSARPTVAQCERQHDRRYWQHQPP